METMREEFEKWWRANEIVPFLEKDESGEYIFSSVRLAFRAWQASARIEREACDTPWKDAVIDQLIIAHILGAEHAADPHKAVADLLNFHSEIAIDPRVSESACKLIEDEREACAKVCEDYEEHIETLRDGEYQAELAGRQAGAARCAVAIRARGGE